jgi:hypothetical protein
VKCKENDKAVIHKYAATDQNPFGHYSIEVNTETKRVHSHQVITDGTTTIVSADEYKPSEPVVEPVTLTLSNAVDAQKYQDAVNFIDMGPYNRKTNSCVTHVANVLRAGGVDIPDSALAMFKYMKGLGF